MLRTASDLKRFELKSRDGDSESIRDFYFDDHLWTVRYFVADTGKWAFGRKVLISPRAISRVDEPSRRLELSLTKAEIQNSPPIESDEPVSRQFEEEYARYYGWTLYGEGPWLWGSAVTPGLIPPIGAPSDETPPKPAGDPHLRSIAEITGYHVHARNGELGHVEEFLIEDRGWRIRWLVIDTKKWWPGKRVLIAPQWIREVSWDFSEVKVTLDRELIQGAPAFELSQPVTAEYASRITEYYERKGHGVEGEHHEAAA